MFSHILVLVPLLLALARPALWAQAQADSVVYHVDPSSRLVVKTGKAGLFGFAGHAHVIRARSITGTLMYHPGQTTSRLSLKVRVCSINVRVALPVFERHAQ